MSFRDVPGPSYEPLCEAFRYTELMNAVLELHGVTSCRLSLRQEDSCCRAQHEEHEESWLG